METGLLNASLFGCLEQIAVEQYVHNKGETALESAQALRPRQLWGGASPELRDALAPVGGRRPRTQEAVRRVGARRSSDQDRQEPDAPAHGVLA